MNEILTAKVKLPAREFPNKYDKSIQENKITGLIVETSGGKEFRIYKAGRYEPYFQYKVGDEVKLEINDEGKIRLIEEQEEVKSASKTGEVKNESNIGEEELPKVPPELDKYFTYHALIYRKAIVACKKVLGDVIKNDEDIRTIATSLYIQATKAGLDATPRFKYEMQKNRQEMQRKDQSER